MTQKEIAYKFGVNFEEANLVHEYLKESKEEDDTFLPVAVNTVITFCREYTKIMDKAPTSEDLQAMYKELPFFITQDYGDRYLMGCINFLMQGRTI